MAYPPKLKGKPLLGSALEMSGDLLPFLLTNYEKMGPIFRVTAFNRPFIVMVGPKANQFLAREGNDLFSVEEIYRGFSEGMQTNNFLLSHDGEYHTLLRKTLRRGYSKQAISPHLQQLVDLTLAATKDWQVGSSIAVVPFFKRLITQQLGTILARRAPDNYLADIQRFFTTLAQVTVAHRWPNFLLNLPPYKKAQARVLELTQQVIQEHREHPSESGFEDIIDDLFAARDANGNPFPEDTYNAVVIGTYLAGIDTVSLTCSFMLYALLKNPDIKKRVIAEIDTYFANGTPSLNELRKMEILSAAVTETLRFHPVAPGITRTVKEPFIFEGYQVDAGEQVIVGTSVTHFLSEFFPDPFTFNIDRYIKPNRQQTQAGIFAPFALGSHTCLGAGMAEIQVMVNMATLLRNYNFQLDPVDYQLEIIGTPTRGPKETFRVRVN